MLIGRSIVSWAAAGVQGRVQKRGQASAAVTAKPRNRILIMTIPPSFRLFLDRALRLRCQARKLSPKAHLSDWRRHRPGATLPRNANDLKPERTQGRT